MFNIYDECIGVFYEENMLCVALLTKMKVIAKRRTTGYRCPGQQGLFNAPSTSYRNEHTDHYFHFYSIGFISLSITFCPFKEPPITDIWDNGCLLL